MTFFGFYPSLNVFLRLLCFSTDFTFSDKLFTICYIRFCSFCYHVFFRLLVCFWVYSRHRPIRIVTDTGSIDWDKQRDCTYIHIFLLKT